MIRPLLFIHINLSLTLYMLGVWHLRGNMKSWSWSFLPYSVLISDIAWNFVILRAACASQRLEGMSSWFSQTVWNVCRAKSFQKLISFSLFAGPASLLVISLKHPGCEELIDSVMLGERVTKALRLNQHINLICCDNTRSSRKLIPCFFLCSEYPRVSLEPEEWFLHLHFLYHSGL